MSKKRKIIFHVKHFYFLIINTVFSSEVIRRGGDYILMIKIKALLMKNNFFLLHKIRKDFLKTPMYIEGHVLHMFHLHLYGTLRAKHALKPIYPQAMRF